MFLRILNTSLLTLFIVHVSIGQVQTSWSKNNTEELKISVKEGPVTNGSLQVMAAGKTEEGNYWSLTSSKGARDQSFTYYQYNMDLEPIIEKPFFNNSKNSNAVLWDVVKVGENYYALFSTKVAENFSTIFSKSIDVSKGHINNDKKLLCNLPWKGKTGFPTSELKILYVEGDHNESACFGISGYQNQGHLYKKRQNTNVLLNYQHVWVFDSALDLRNSASMYSGRGKVLRPVHSGVFIDKYYSIFSIDKSELINFTSQQEETYKGGAFSIKHFCSDGNTYKYESERDIYLSDINIFSKSKDVFGIVGIFTSSIWNKQYKSRLKQILLDKKTMEIVEEIDYPFTEELYTRVKEFRARDKKKTKIITLERNLKHQLKSNDLFEGTKVIFIRTNADSSLLVVLEERAIEVEQLVEIGTGRVVNKIEHYYYKDFVLCKLDGDRASYEFIDKEVEFVNIERIVDLDFRITQDEELQLWNSRNICRVTSSLNGVKIFSEVADYFKELGESSQDFKLHKTIFLSDDEVLLFYSKMGKYVWVKWSID